MIVKYLTLSSCSFSSNKKEDLPPLSGAYLHYCYTYMDAAVNQTSILVSKTCLKCQYCVFFLVSLYIHWTSVKIQAVFYYAEDITLALGNLSSNQRIIG